MGGRGTDAEAPGNIRHFRLVDTHEIQRFCLEVRYQHLAVFAAEDRSESHVNKRAHIFGVVQIVNRTYFPIAFWTRIAGRSRNEAFLQHSSRSRVRGVGRKKQRWRVFFTRYCLDEPPERGRRWDAAERDQEYRSLFVRMLNTLFWALDPASARAQRRNAIDDW